MCSGTQVGFVLDQRFASPISESGSCVIGGLGKLKQSFIRRGTCPDRFIREDKLLQLRVVRGRTRLNLRGGKSWRFRISIGIENRIGHLFVTWPKPNATHLLGISLTCDRVG